MTAELAENATGYMEWVLEVRFTAAQRQQYQQMLAEMWRGGNQGSTDAVVKMAMVYDRLSQLGENERAQMRSGSQQQLVKLLETAADDQSRWLLGIYRAAHQPSQTSAAPLGRWIDGHISSIQYQNVYTRESAPANGRFVRV